ncbi:hypothetical protein Acr_26g0001630 [Actinidia rufa]|uniref:Uncharacterized protein n=1 Tax=Actinidia rufa TaxID=165716 RepID=A0A7J0H1C5_9ERIC|nr:hypothetical protein Acr_26g0001630 [Actinidia rufa]
MIRPAQLTIFERFSRFRSGGYNGPLAIWLQGHFGIPNIPYMKAAIDKLGAARLPICFSEALHLEQVLREGRAHPRANGIILWSAWTPQGCDAMCLTDNNFRNLPTVDVVDELMKEWGQPGLSGTTDSDGQIQARLFHADYKVTVTHLSMADSSVVAQNFEVVPMDKSSQVLHVKVSALRAVSATNVIIWRLHCKFC